MDFELAVVNYNVKTPGEGAMSSGISNNCFLSRFFTQTVSAVF